MNKPIAIFFHGLFFMGDPPRYLPHAVDIIVQQIAKIIDSGLWHAAKEIHFGINGGVESGIMSTAVIPEMAKVRFHGLESRSENLTIVMLHEWAKTHPGWNVLYLHAKGASHPPESTHSIVVETPWRDLMMQDLVGNWRQCVADLATHDIVCSQWKWDQADGTQHIPAGNFLWTTSDFVAKLPSIHLRERVKQDGIGSASSRFEAEVFWGNGPRPNVKSYRSKLPYEP